MNRSLLLLLILALLSCQDVEERDGKKSKVKDGISRKFRKDGSLKTEVNYKAGKKEGLSRDFYENGRVHLEIYYKDGYKDGMAKWYYENGKPYMTCNYDYGHMDGIETKYYENGKIMSEMPWKSKMPGLGLKEYSKTGKLLSNCPAIEFEVIDQIAMTGDYTLKVRLSDNSTIVRFWQGKLFEDTFLNEISINPLIMNDGVGTIHFHLAQGQFIMEKLNIIAKVKTYKRNYYVLQKSYNLAIDRKSF